jgi:ribosomal protein L11 methyltransferase
MSWQRLTIHLPSALIDPCDELLNEMGALTITLEAQTNEELFEPPRNETPLWQQTTLHALFDVDVDLHALIPSLAQAIFPEKLHYQITLVADQDWQKVCTDAFKTICFANKLWVYPSWDASPADGKPALLLDPGLAFGTGTHPTTALCLEWLATELSSGESVIDYGCGSGILALAALKLGARKAWAVDNDPQAIEATLENASRNGLAAPQIEVVLPENHTKEPANILIANILANPLIDLAPHFASLVTSGGKIALSGILMEQAQRVTEAYMPWFEFSAPEQTAQWMLLKGVKY